MTRGRCYDVDVDGTVVRASFTREPTEADLEAFRAVVRATIAEIDKMPPRCGLLGSRPGGALRIPCAEPPGHEPPHRAHDGTELTDRTL